MNETNAITSTNAINNVVDSIKDSGISGLLEYFTTLDSIHYVTFIINLFIFIFGKSIINNAHYTKNSRQALNDIR